MKFFPALLLILFIPNLKEKDINDLTINKIQVIGSHNSYKQAIDPALFKVFQRKDSVSASQSTTNISALRRKLNMGLRNLEIDVYSNEKGGR